MSIDDIPSRPIPWWFKVLAVVLCLPLLAFPRLVSLCPPDTSAETMLWIYPFFTLLSAWLALACYGRRHELSWVLMGVLLLSHGAMWLLVDPSILL